MAQYIADHCPRPDLILCSTAVRTRQTLAPLLKRLRSPAPPIALEAGLYLASETTLLLRLRELSDDIDVVLLVGHNDGIGQTAAALAGAGPPERLVALNDKYPTGALAVLMAPADQWRDLAVGSAELRDFVRPRDLSKAKS